MKHEKDDANKCDQHLVSSALLKSACVTASSCCLLADFQV